MSHLALRRASVPAADRDIAGHCRSIPAYSLAFYSVQGKTAVVIAAVGTRSIYLHIAREVDIDRAYVQVVLRHLENLQESICHLADPHLEERAAGLVQLDHLDCNMVRLASCILFQISKVYNNSFTILKQRYTLPLSPTNVTML